MEQSPAKSRRETLRTRAVVQHPKPARPRPRSTSKQPPRSRPLIAPKANVVLPSDPTCAHCEARPDPGWRRALHLNGAAREANPQCRTGVLCLQTDQGQGEHELAGGEVPVRSLTTLVVRRRAPEMRPLYRERQTMWLRWRGWPVAAGGHEGATRGSGEAVQQSTGTDARRSSQPAGAHPLCRRRCLRAGCLQKRQQGELH